MFKSVAAKSMTALAAAAMIAGMLAFLTSAVPEAKAEPQIEASVQPTTNGDRPSPRETGAACSSRSWPYYDQSCQFDLRRPADEPPTAVRIIAFR